MISVLIKKIGYLDKKLITLFLVVLNFTHYYKVYDPEWGSNDISGFDLILANYFGEYIQLPLFHSPLISGIIKFNAYFLDDASLELTYGIPIFLFSAYLVKEINNSSGWSKVFIGATILFLSSPFLIVIIHNLSSSIFCGVFALLIFSNYFSETQKISYTNIVLASCLLFLAFNYRVGSEAELISLIFLICLPLFIFFSKHSLAVSISSLSKVAFFCASVFFFYLTVKNIYFLPLYEKEFGENFFQHNAVRHAVQVSITMPFETKKELLGLNDLNQTILRFFPIPEKLYSNDWFAAAFEILSKNVKLEGQLTNFNLSKVLNTIGLDFVFWQIILSFLILICFRNTKSLLVLLLSIILPIIIVISTTIISRHPPLRFWFPALMSCQIISLILIVEIYKELIKNRVIDKIGSPIKEMQIYILFGLGLLEHKENKESPNSKTYILPLSSFLILMSIFGTLSFSKSVADTHRKSYNATCEINALYSKLSEQNEKYIAYPGVFSSVCLIRPLAGLSFPDLDMLLVGGTSFLTKRFQNQYYEKGGIIGHICNENRKLIFNKNLFNYVEAHLGEHIVINELQVDNVVHGRYYSGSCKSSKNKGK